MQGVETEFKLWEDFVLASIDGSCWREFSGFLEELILANQTGSPPLIHPFLAPPPVYNHHIQDITIMELFTLRICATNTARLALYDKAQKRGSLKEFGLIVPVNEQQTYFVKKNDELQSCHTPAIAPMLDDQFVQFNILPKPSDIWLSIHLSQFLGQIGS